jgi:hypothetical protein
MKTCIMTTLGPGGDGFFFLCCLLCTVVEVHHTSVWLLRLVQVKELLRGRLATLLGFLTRPKVLPSPSAFHRPVCSTPRWCGPQAPSLKASLCSLDCMTNESSLLPPAAGVYCVSVYARACVRACLRVFVCFPQV